MNSTTTGARPTLSFRSRWAASRDRLRARLFSAVHCRQLLYNTCWEDPALDRIALQLTDKDRVLVIASAGCNALDYLLAGAGQVHAVDMNPIQIALVELKACGIRLLDHATFWRLFGQGGYRGSYEIYRDTLRPHLTETTRRYWDTHFRSFFCGRGWRASFYYRGASGLLARLALIHVKQLRGLRSVLDRLLAADTLDEQRAAYDVARPRLWGRGMNWLLSRDVTMTLAGVPGPQRLQIDRSYPGGMAQFIRDQVEYVFTRLPLKTNYFWRVYLQGHYDRDCCPSYLTPAGFATLKAGAIDRLSLHCDTVTGFLRNSEPGVTRFVLLDHMDWMAHAGGTDALRGEWEAILDTAGPGARVIYRSAGLSVDYLDPLAVTRRGRTTTVGGCLSYHRALAERLHVEDRVHTYGSFAIADIRS